MAYTLYEYELVEHIDYWYEGVLADQEDLVFVVTENSGHTAMVLITKGKDIYVNEDARQKLSEMWDEVYPRNMELLIPRMVKDLANDIFAVTGVKTVPSKGP